MSRQIKKTLAALIILILATYPTLSISGPESYPAKGYIKNSYGDKCRYTQKIIRENTYFYRGNTQHVGLLTFDNATCMTATSNIDKTTNKMLINRTISRWYSHPDAKFKTHPNDVSEPRKIAKNGFCIQSATYPMAGINIDYIGDPSIEKVIHGNAFMCSEL